MRYGAINLNPRKISTKLIFILVLCALAPLLIYGILSIWTSRKACFESVSDGNKWVAIGTADQIESYIKYNLSILQGLANNINRIYLDTWQKKIIIRNFVINFAEFREISVLDRNGLETASSRLEEKPRDRSGEKPFQSAIQGRTYFSEVFISDSLVPSMIIALPISITGNIDGVIIGEIDLSDMWHLVDRIRIGNKGITFVVSRSGFLIAHGDDERKPDVFRQKNLYHLEIVKSVLQGKTATLLYTNDTGNEVLGTGHPLKLLGWGVIVERPAGEAFMIATRMSRALSALIVFFLMIMITFGIIGGKRVTGPIHELIEATRSIASGDLSRKVSVSSQDEFEELGNSFNLMTEKLAQLQEEIRINERLSIFARLAAGLVHDLKHPIRNIENSSNLILRLYNDQEYREVFHKTVQKEFSNINRFLEDLHNLTRPAPVVAVELNVEALLKDMINLYRDDAAQKEIDLQLTCQPHDVRISADRFLLERIIKNLMTNAIEAMPKGGYLRITLSRDDGFGLRKAMAKISIEDTGVGISRERIDTIFTDYVTTKRRGLGLGLAITRKNVLELGGSIAVVSEPGKGSTFTLTFPLAGNHL